MSTFSWVSSIAKVAKIKVTSCHTKKPTHNDVPLENKSQCTSFSNATFKKFNIRTCWSALLERCMTSTFSYIKDFIKVSSPKSL